MQRQRHRLAHRQAGSRPLHSLGVRGRWKIHSEGKTVSLMVKNILQYNIAYPSTTKKPHRKTPDRLLFNVITVGLISCY